MKPKKLLLICLLLAAMLVTACSQSPDGSGGQEKLTGNLDPKNPVTVTLWHYYVSENQLELESAVSAFNQTIGMEKGVIVEAIAIGSIAELEENITNSAKGVINARPMPQIFSSYPDKAMEIDALEKVVDLSAYFTAEEKAEYVDDFLADGIFSGDRMLLLPIVKSTELTYVNKTSWDAFAQSEGFDTGDMDTWEKFYETAKAYYEWTDAQTPDTPWDGKGIMGFDSVANYIIAGARQLGLDVIDATRGESGAAVLDEAALRPVFDVYFKGISLGYFDAVGKFRSDDIKAGNLIAYVGSSSSAAYFPTWIEKENQQEEIDFLPLAYPTFEGGTSVAIQQGAGMCVAKSTPAQQEGSVLFLKWFTDVEQNIGFAMTTGYLPVRKAAYEAASFTTALETLRTGEKAQQNVAGVYEIALHQITEANTYAAKPFTGSYTVRSTLQSSLIDSALKGREDAAPLKAQNAGEAEILEALDIDARFEAWLQAVADSLDAAQIAYERVSQ